MRIRRWLLMSAALWPAHDKGLDGHRVAHCELGHDGLALVGVRGRCGDRPRDAARRDRVDQAGSAVEGAEEVLVDRHDVAGCLGPGLLDLHSASIRLRGRLVLRVRRLGWRGALGDAGGDLRPLSLRYGRRRQSLGARLLNLGAGHHHRGARGPLRSLGTDGPNRARRALGTDRPNRPNGTLEALGASRATPADQALWPSLALRAARTLGARAQDATHQLVIRVELEAFHQRLARVGRSDVSLRRGGIGPGKTGQGPHCHADGAKGGDSSETCELHETSV